MEKDFFTSLAMIALTVAVQGNAQASSFAGRVLDSRSNPVNRIEITFYGEGTRKGPLSAPIVYDSSKPQQGHFSFENLGLSGLGEIKTCAFRLFRDNVELELWSFHDQVKDCDPAAPLALVVIEPPRFKVELTVVNNRERVLENFHQSSHSIFPGLSLKDGKGASQYSHMPYPMDVKETDDGLSFSVKEPTAWAMSPEEFEQGSAIFSFRAAPREWIDMEMKLSGLLRHSGGELRVHRTYPDDFHVVNYQSPPPDERCLAY